MLIFCLKSFNILSQINNMRKKVQKTVCIKFVFCLFFIYIFNFECSSSSSSKEKVNIFGQFHALVTTQFCNIYTLFVHFFYLIKCYFHVFFSFSQQKFRIANLVFLFFFSYASISYFYLSFFLFFYNIRINLTYN